MFIKYTVPFAMIDLPNSSDWFMHSHIVPARSVKAYEWTHLEKRYFPAPHRCEQERIWSLELLLTRGAWEWADAIQVHTDLICELTE